MLSPNSFPDPCSRSQKGVVFVWLFPFFSRLASRIQTYRQQTNETTNNEKRLGFECRICEHSIVSCKQRHNTLYTLNPNVPVAGFDRRNMPKICLGTRLLNVSTKDQPSSLGSKDDGSRASLSVECRGENENSVLDIKLLTNSCDSYACTLSPCDLSLFSKAEVSPFDQALALGRLLLRAENSDDDSHANEWRNKTATFQFESINDREHNDLYLLVHENLSNGMKRRTLKEKLQRLNNGGLGYAMALGAALNQSLEEKTEQKSGRDHWKNTAETLEKLQQQSKETLLQNFTNLRNKMFRRHQAELQELKDAHQSEKETWEITLAAAKQRAPAKRKKKPEALELSTTNELFDQNEIMALAEGRKLDSGHYGQNATQKSPPPRKTFLKADEVVDMVKIRKKGLEFQNRNHEKRKRAKESRRNQNDEPGGKDDDRKRKAAAGGNTRKQRKLASPPRIARERQQVTENATEAPSDRNGDSPPWRITKKPTTKKAPSLQAATAADDESTASESSWVLR